MRNKKCKCKLAHLRRGRVWSLVQRDAPDSSLPSIFFLNALFFLKERSPYGRKTLVCLGRPHSFSLPILRARHDLLHSSSARLTATPLLGENNDDRWDEVATQFLVSPLAHAAPSEVAAVVEEEEEGPTPGSSSPKEEGPSLPVWDHLDLRQTGPTTATRPRSGSRRFESGTRSTRSSVSGGGKVEE